MAEVVKEETHYHEDGATRSNGGIVTAVVVVLIILVALVLFSRFGRGGTSTKSSGTNATPSAQVEGSASGSGSYTGGTSGQ